MSVDISELINNQKENPQKSSNESLMEQILRADMEMMLKYGRNGNHREFPDPVRPQWKN